MLRFAVRRLLLLVPILVGLSILVFVWVRALPGGPEAALLGERATPERVVEVRHQFGLDKPVYHYTELLADLVAQGVISMRTPLSGTRVTYHDPCYLARYNRITEAPRKLIEATGAELVEMPRNGTNTFCCGAGGGRIWMMDDAEISERPSEQRIREAQTLGELDYFLVSCPKDLAMYSDAAKVVGADFEVAELTALIERALAEAEPVTRRSGR